MKLNLSRANWMRWAVGLIGCGLVVWTLSAQGAPLSAGEPILLENTHGKFDFIRLDATRHRLLLAHTGNKTLDVFDLNSKRLLKSVSTGAAQDCTADLKGERYYVSVSDPPQMAIVDANTLEMTGEVALQAAADLMACNPANGLAYVCNDTAAQLWVIDPQAKKIVHTITLEGSKMEDLAFDPQAKRLFQVVSGINSLAVIDPSDNKVRTNWSVMPAAKPHGMALVPEADTLLVAGGSGKLALLNRSTGKVLASAGIEDRVDEMAYDSQLHVAYCPGGSGKISVLRVEGDKLTSLGAVPGSLGRSVVVDPATHIVWIAGTKGEQCFVQPFTPAQ